MRDPLSRDVARRRGEKIPTLSLGRSPYNPQFRTLAAVSSDLLSRLKDAERSLSKISTAAAENDDTEMMANVSKGNAAVASIKKAAQVLRDVTSDLGD